MKVLILFSFVIYAFYSLDRAEALGLSAGAEFDPEIAQKLQLLQALVQEAQNAGLGVLGGGKDSDSDVRRRRQLGLENLLGGILRKDADEGDRRKRLLGLEHLLSGLLGKDADEATRKKRLLGLEHLLGNLLGKRDSNDAERKKRLLFGKG